MYGIMYDVWYNVVSEPDPRKIEKEGLAPRLGIMYDVWYNVRWMVQCTMYGIMYDVWYNVLIMQEKCTTIDDIVRPYYTIYGTMYD